MSKEKYHQIIDEVYEKYHQENKHVTYLTFLLREEFINRIKKDKGFSEKWGLKIEERELSQEERKKLYEDGFTPGMEVTNDHWLNSKLTTRNIPTKLITLEYNNEKIEIYE